MPHNTTHEQEFASLQQQIALLSRELKECVGKPELKEVISM
jgi:hypothetical protein